MSEAKGTNWTNRIDAFIQWFKWPAAAFALLTTPLLCWGLVRVALRVVTSPIGILPFVLGAVAFVILWRKWLGGSRTGRFLITLEHESTHALFAVLTGHRLVGFRASVGRGGEVRFVGRGNWLITVAPYFFPTAALLLFAIAFFLPFPGLPWQGFLLGVALGYHLVSTYRETHRDQSDIKQLGRTFCWLFLPAANFAVVGLLISFAHGGTEGTQLWFHDILEPIQLLLDQLRQLFEVPQEEQLPAP